MTRRCIFMVSSPPKLVHLDQDQHVIKAGLNLNNKDITVSIARPSPCFIKPLLSLLHLANENLAANIVSTEVGGGYAFKFHHHLILQKCENVLIMIFV